MAGIGFELKKILKKESLTSLFVAYSYATILSAGGWVASILSILTVGFINILLYDNSVDIIRFQVSVTHLIALSLIVSGVHQLVFTRFIADKIYIKEEKAIIPNLIGIIILNTAISGIFIIIYSLFALKGIDSFYFNIFFIMTFLLLSNIWILNIIAVSIKKYKHTIIAYFLSYLLVLIFASVFGKYGLDYLIGSFFLSNIFLFLTLLFLVIKSYFFSKFISFEFIKYYKKYFSLMLAGFFFNLGIWSDEFMFWYSSTGTGIIGKINASIVYDLPLFLAYLTTIPGLAIFFIRLEADFAELYDKYFKGVVNGATLYKLLNYKNSMIDLIRISTKEAIIIQGIFNIIFYLTAPKIINLLNLPLLIVPLFYIDMVAIQLQLIVMITLAFLFYMNKRKEAAIVTFIMATLNIILPIISINLGPYFYGYGSAIAMLIASIAGLLFLNKSMIRMEYETFMLQ